MSYLHLINKTFWYVLIRDLNRDDL